MAEKNIFKKQKSSHFSFSNCWLGIAFATSFKSKCKSILWRFQRGKINSDCFFFSTNFFYFWSSCNSGVRFLAVPSPNKVQQNTKVPPLSLLLLLLLLRFVLPTPTAASQTHMKRGFPFSFPFLNFSAAPKRTEGKEQEKKNKKKRRFPHFFPCKIALSAPAQRKENWGETGRGKRKRQKNKDTNSPNIFQKFYFCKAHQWKSQKLDSMVHFSKKIGKF